MLLCPHARLRMICRRQSICSARHLSTRHYDVLGIKGDALQAEVKMAYFRKAKAFHPDINKAASAAQRFRQITDAYKVLRNPASRAAYDSGRPEQASVSSMKSRERKSWKTYAPGQTYASWKQEIFRDLTQFSWHLIGVEDVRQATLIVPVLVVPQLAYPGLLGLLSRPLAAVRIQPLRLPSPRWGSTCARWRRASPRLLQQRRRLLTTSRPRASGQLSTVAGWRAAAWCACSSRPWCLSPCSLACASLAASTKTRSSCSRGAKPRGAPRQQACAAGCGESGRGGCEVLRPDIEGVRRAADLD